MTKGRKDVIAKFLDSEGPQVLLGSKILERGLNLQEVRVLISLDPSYNPAREVQREGRIRRIGSPHDTYEHLTLLPDTPDARAKWKLLADKRAMGVTVGA